MTVNIFFDKVRRRICRNIYKHTHSWSKSYFLYRSYWHYLFHHPNKGKTNTTQYYSARPNPRAGIGHQMANWNAGYWWARQFGLSFAHIPFVKQTWDDFLGFGLGEKKVSDLIDKEGYKLIKLPKFDGNYEKEVTLQQSIISSYIGRKIVFVAEQDQGYHDQYGAMEDIKRKFYSAPARKNDSLIYDKNHFNIAVHARRGDIMSDSNNPNLTKRILSNQYFYNALRGALGLVSTDKDVHIYFFSQGSPADFPEFKEFKNLHWCFDMSAQQSFLHMVYADLLITSKSSFSYKPALLNKGFKVCPKDFWHGYPESNDWYLCDNQGFLI